MDERTLYRIIRRGVAEIIPEREFVERLIEGKPLRLKMGFDPSRPDIHLGHVVGLRKLRQLQELGHQVVLIVGDWTAQIGDPSGQSATRPMLTAEEVKENADTYIAQFSRVVDASRTEVVWQSEWFGGFTLADVIRLTSRFTVAQFLARDDFAKRHRENRPIAVTEFLYPLLQAYDSVAIRSDVEFGGTDQKFNLLVGRDLQDVMGQRPQVCFTMPILVGTDGVQKMSKSLGNYIGVDEPPVDMFGKVMSLPDRYRFQEHVIATPQLGPERAEYDPHHLEAARFPVTDYLEWLTDVSDEQITQMKRDLLEGSVNPMEIKKRLGREIVAQFHGGEAARRAQEHFERVFQRRQAPEEVRQVEVPGQGEGVQVQLTRFLTDHGLTASRGEAKRLLLQGAVQVDGERVKDDSLFLPFGALLKVGRYTWARVCRETPTRP